MTHQAGAVFPGQGAEGVFPREVIRIEVRPIRKDAPPHQFDDVLTVVDVVVQRRLANAQLPGHPGEAEVSGGIDQGQGRTYDGVYGQERRSRAWHEDSSA